jgi:hypothetical protein
MTLDELRVQCAAAGLDVPEADLPRLAEAFANHLASIEAVRAIAAGEDLWPEGFDPRWT